MSFSLAELEGRKVIPGGHGGAIGRLSIRSARFDRVIAPGSHGQIDGVPDAVS